VVSKGVIYYFLSKRCIKTPFSEDPGDGDVRTLFCAQRRARGELAARVPIARPHRCGHGAGVRLPAPGSGSSWRWAPRRGRLPAGSVGSSLIDGIKVLGKMGVFLLPQRCAATCFASLGMSSVSMCFANLGMSPVNGLRCGSEEPSSRVLPWQHRPSIFVYLD